MPSTRHAATCVGALLFLPVYASAQDTTRAALPTVKVTATREGPRPAVELPYAVTITRPDSLAALRKTGVDELLFAVPGVALAKIGRASCRERV